MRPKVSKTKDYNRKWVEYTIQQRSTAVQRMLANPSVRTILSRTGCTIDVQSSQTNGTIPSDGSATNEIAILRVNVPDDLTLNQLNTELENSYPAYRSRQIYRHQVPLIIDHARRVMSEYTKELSQTDQFTGAEISFPSTQQGDTKRVSLSEPVEQDSDPFVSQTPINSNVVRSELNLHNIGKPCTLVTNPIVTFMPDPSSGVVTVYHEIVYESRPQSENVVHAPGNPCSVVSKSMLNYHFDRTNSTSRSPTMIMSTEANTFLNLPIPTGRFDSVGFHQSIEMCHTIVHGNPAQSPELKSDIEATSLQRSFICCNGLSKHQTERKPVECVPPYDTNLFALPSENSLSQRQTPLEPKDSSIKVDKPCSSTHAAMAHIIPSKGGPRDNVTIQSSTIQGEGSLFWEQTLAHSGAQQAISAYTARKMVMDVETLKDKENEIDSLMHINEKLEITSSMVPLCGQVSVPHQKPLPLLFTDSIVHNQILPIANNRDIPKDEIPENQQKEGLNRRDNHINSHTSSVNMSANLDELAHTKRLGENKGQGKPLKVTRDETQLFIVVKISSPGVQEETEFEPIEVLESVAREELMIQHQSVAIEYSTDTEDNESMVRLGEKTCEHDTCIENETLSTELKTGLDIRLAKGLIDQNRQRSAAYGPLEQKPNQSMYISVTEDIHIKMEQGKAALKNKLDVIVEENRKTLCDQAEKRLINMTREKNKIILINQATSMEIRKHSGIMLAPKQNNKSMKLKEEQAIDASNIRETIKSTSLTSINSPDARTINDLLQNKVIKPSVTTDGLRVTNRVHHQDRNSGETALLMPFNNAPSNANLLLNQKNSLMPSISYNAQIIADTVARSTETISKHVNTINQLDENRISVDNDDKLKDTIGKIPTNVQSANTIESEGTTHSLKQPHICFENSETTKQNGEGSSYKFEKEVLYVNNSKRSASNDRAQITVPLLPISSRPMIGELGQCQDNQSEFKRMNIFCEENMSLLIGGQVVTEKTRMKRQEDFRTNLSQVDQSERKNSIKEGVISTQPIASNLAPEMIRTKATSKVKNVNDHPYSNIATIFNEGRSISNEMTSNHSEQLWPMVTNISNPKLILEISDIPQMTAEAEADVKMQLSSNGPDQSFKTFSGKRACIQDITPLKQVISNNTSETIPTKTFNDPPTRVGSGENFEATTILQRVAHDQPYVDKELTEELKTKEVLMNQVPIQVRFIHPVDQLHRTPNQEHGITSSPEFSINQQHQISSSQAIVVNLTPSLIRSLIISKADSVVDQPCPTVSRIYDEACCSLYDKLSDKLQSMNETNARKLVYGVQHGTSHVSINSLGGEQLMQEHCPSENEIGLNQIASKTEDDATTISYSEYDRPIVTNIAYPTFTLTNTNLPLMAVKTEMDGKTKLASTESDQSLVNSSTKLETIPNLPIVSNLVFDVTRSSVTLKASSVTDQLCPTVPHMYDKGRPDLCEIPSDKVQSISEAIEKNFMSESLHDISNEASDVLCGERLIQAYLPSYDHMHRNRITSKTEDDTTTISYCEHDLPVATNIVYPLLSITNTDEPQMIVQEEMNIKTKSTPSEFDKRFGNSSRKRTGIQEVSILKHVMSSNRSETAPATTVSGSLMSLVSLKHSDAATIVPYLANDQSDINKELIQLKVEEALTNLVPIQIKSNQSIDQICQISSQEHASTTDRELSMNRQSQLSPPQPIVLNLMPDLIQSPVTSETPSVMYQPCPTVPSVYFKGCRSLHDKPSDNIKSIKELSERKLTSDIVYDGVEGKRLMEGQIPSGYDMCPNRITSQTADAIKTFSHRGENKSAATYIIYPQMNLSSTDAPRITPETGSDVKTRLLLSESDRSLMNTSEKRDSIQDLTVFSNPASDFTKSLLTSKALSFADLPCPTVSGLYGEGRRNLDDKSSDELRSVSEANEAWPTGLHATFDVACDVVGSKRLFYANFPMAYGMPLDRISSTTKDGETATNSSEQSHPNVTNIKKNNWILPKTDTSQITDEVQTDIKASESERNLGSLCRKHEDIEKVSSLKHVISGNISENAPTKIRNDSLVSPESIKRSSLDKTVSRSTHDQFAVDIQLAQLANHVPIHMKSGQPFGQPYQTPNQEYKIKQEPEFIMSKQSQISSSQPIVPNMMSDLTISVVTSKAPSVVDQPCPIVPSIYDESRCSLRDKASHKLQSINKSSDNLHADSSLSLKIDDDGKCLVENQHEQFTPASNELQSKTKPMFFDVSCHSGTTTFESVDLNSTAGVMPQMAVEKQSIVISNGNKLSVDPKDISCASFTSIRPTLINDRQPYSKASVTTFSDTTQINPIDVNQKSTAECLLYPKPYILPPLEMTNVTDNLSQASSKHKIFDQFSDKTKHMLDNKHPVSANARPIISQSYSLVSDRDSLHNQQSEISSQTSIKFASETTSLPNTYHDRTQPGPAWTIADTQPTNRDYFIHKNLAGQTQLMVDSSEVQISHSIVSCERKPVVESPISVDYPITLETLCTNSPVFDIPFCLELCSSWEHADIGIQTSVNNLCSTSKVERSGLHGSGCSCGLEMISCLPQGGYSAFHAVLIPLQSSTLCSNRCCARTVNVLLSRKLLSSVRGHRQANPASPIFSGENIILDYPPLNRLPALCSTDERKCFNGQKEQFAELPTSSRRVLRIAKEKLVPVNDNPEMTSSASSYGVERNLTDKPISSYCLCSSIGCQLARSKEHMKTIKCANLTLPLVEHIEKEIKPNHCFPQHIVASKSAVIYKGLAYDSYGRKIDVPRCGPCCASFRNVRGCQCCRIACVCKCHPFHRVLPKQGDCICCPISCGGLNNKPSDYLLDGISKFCSIRSVPMNTFPRHCSPCRTACGESRVMVHKDTCFPHSHCCCYYCFTNSNRCDCQSNQLCRCTPSATKPCAYPLLVTTTFLSGSGTRCGCRSQNTNSIGISEPYVEPTFFLANHTQQQLLLNHSHLKQQQEQHKDYSDPITSNSTTIPILQTTWLTGKTVVTDQNKRPKRVQKNTRNESPSNSFFSRKNKLRQATKRVTWSTQMEPRT